MIDAQLASQLLPRALQWAREQEETILSRGSPLSEAAQADARRVGVQDPARVRVLVVDRISLPEDAQLAEVSRRTHIITENSRAVAIGHGIIIRADHWGNRELLLHQLVHVAQSERCGGTEAYVEQYLRDRQNSPEFSIGTLEEEARRLAHDICRA